MKTKHDMLLEGWHKKVSAWNRAADDIEFIINDRDIDEVEKYLRIKLVFEQTRAKEHYIDESVIREVAKYEAENI